MKRPSQKSKSSGSHQTMLDQECTVSLRLYVAGLTPNSQRARANLKAALTRIEVKKDVHVEIVDVLMDARRALADNVIVTPTLLRLDTVKPQVMIGDLSDADILQSFVSSHIG